MGVARRRMAGRIGVAVLFLLSYAAAALAQKDLFGQAILGYTFFGTDYLTQQGFGQIYDLGYDRQVSEPLRFRLFFRGQGNRFNQDVDKAQRQSTFWLLQPHAELDYTLPLLQFIGRYDYASEISNFENYLNQPSSTRLVRRGIGILTWTPEVLPSLTLVGEERRYTDSTAGIDQAETLVSEALSYNWRALRVGQFGQYRTLDLYNTNFHRTALDGQLLGQYDNSWFDGHASLSANATVGVTKLEETSQSGSAASVPNQITITTASYAHDETPLDSRDAPAAPKPSLTDNDFRTASDISLGPDGLSFQNLVIDTGRFVVLDTFRVFVRDSAGNLLRFGGLVRWDVYTSENGFDWTPAGIADTRFLVSVSAYEVSFRGIRSRLFRVVSFGTSSVETFVTEIQAFFHTEFAANQTRETDIHFVSGTLTASGRPAGWLTLSYYGIFNDYKTTQLNRSEFASADNDQLLSAEFLPTASLDLTLRAERRRVSPTGAVDQTLQGYWGILTYNFNPNLSTTVEAYRTQETGLRDIRTTALRATQYLRFYSSLYFQLDGGVANQDFDRGDLSSRSTYFDVVGNAQLTRALLLTLNLNYQKRRDEGPLAGVTGGLERLYQRYYGQIQYRPTSQLNFIGRYGYTKLTGLNAQLRSLRVEWYPFAGGTVGIGTVYEEDVDANFEYRRFRRIQILPTWIVNPHATLSLNYNFLTLHRGLNSSDTGIDTRARQFQLTLTLTL